MFTLKLTNFRSFKEQVFHFSKVNILIGENSSGKSSLFKFLLALKQTIQIPASRDINLLFKGEFADLGSYKESVYYQDDSLPISFAFTFDDQYFNFFNSIILAASQRGGERQREKKKIAKYFNYTHGSDTSVEYTVNNKLNQHENIRTIFKNKNIGDLEIIHTTEKREKKDAFLFAKTCTLIFNDRITGKQYQFNDVEYDKEGFMSLIVGNNLREQIKEQMLVPSLDEPEFIEQVDEIWYRIAFFLITQNYLKYYLDKIQYINPINTHPSRVYLYRDQKRTTSIDDIEDVVEFFSSDSAETMQVQMEFVQILKKLGIAEDIEIIKDERLPVRELRVKVKDLLSNISDVGYGVSLQLPVILKALLSERLPDRKNSMIFIEQPEVHLHPKLHAELISVLLSLSKNTVYFIETHSEHIIRKLQVLIKEKTYELNSSDVTIHYLKRVKLQSEVTSHRITESGTLNPSFPSGFFDNSYILAKELLD